MVKNSFLQRCIRETLSGLREGLSLFSGATRAAIIYAIDEESELFIYDPQKLLRGYEPRLEAIYYNSDGNPAGSRPWCNPIDYNPSYKSYNHIQIQPDLQLDGLISQGGSSTSVYYQMWFTDHHPNLCSKGPTECWLEHTVLRFSHDIANDSTLYTGISGNFLKEYATHAVHDCIVDKAGESLGLDVQIQIYPMLEAILGISKTNEEGATPHGSLTFVEPLFLDRINFFARFNLNERPRLSHYKHVRKLLQATEHRGSTLISDGNTIVGVASDEIFDFNIKACFQGKLGFLSVNNELLCSFKDGSYSSDTHQAKLFEVEEALLDFNIEQETRIEIFQIIATLVHNAEDKMFGCTFVIDLSRKKTSLAGQSLEPPLNLKSKDNLQLAGALSKVDGALHIRSDLHLYAFACLLDGFQVPNEDRARGARYNSALRFTAQHPETIIVVVSADRPVSVFVQGKEKINKFNGDSAAKWQHHPIRLKKWLTEPD